MQKYKIILPFIMTAVMITAAYGQDKPGNFQTKIISGTVTGTDFVGSTISILTNDQHPMSFYVPGNAIITWNTHDIGLMDVKVSHPITIKYDISSSGKDTVDNIVDNQPVTSS